MTPVKAQQAKPADDLDKLLGSRLKSVRPQVELRPSEEAAASPVAALRGQLRRVKLEPDEAGLPSARQGRGQETGGLPDDPAQVRTAHVCKLENILYCVVRSAATERRLQDQISLLSLSSRS